MGQLLITAIHNGMDFIAMLDLLGRITSTDALHFQKNYSHF